MARRLVERGVRFVQVFDATGEQRPGTSTADLRENLPTTLPGDRPADRRAC